VFLIFFVYITGFEPSVLRAVIMAVTILSGQIIRRDTDIYTSMAFSAVLLLVISPHMLFNIGFQLSYTATLSLVLFCKPIKLFMNCRFIPDKIADILAATIAAQVGVLPITAVYFNKVSLISLFSNLLVVPLLEGITILGMAMAVLGYRTVANHRVYKLWTSVVCTLYYRIVIQLAFFNYKDCNTRNTTHNHILLYAMVLFII
jgi:competence protein ComEC